MRACRFGRAAYVWTGAKNLGSPPFRARIDVDGMISFLLRPSMVAPAASDASEPPRELEPLKLAKLTTMVTPSTAASACLAATGNA